MLFVIVFNALIAITAIKVVIIDNESVKFRQTVDSRFVEFMQYCENFQNKTYIVVRNDIEEVYLKCSK